MNRACLYAIIVLALNFIRVDTCAQKMPEEKTSFQTSAPWKPTIDVRADIAMVYGAGDRPNLTFEQRVKSWRDRGYNVQFMTGIAWGNYQDYFTGKWDGKWHLDEGQVQRNGDTIWHGHMVPCIVPSDNFIKYMQEAHIKKVIDAGINAIYLEEPEFWARAGYSEAFKREWEKYYGFGWQPQHESPQSTYLSNKLKYHLYYRAIEECSKYAKEYGKKKGMDVRVYIPTHSLVNYSQWRIVSPEASLASLPSVDGYIAQVWTGTSRSENYYNGLEKERVFETAFLEYGSMESMTAPTGRKMFFLTDPIEDWPRDWGDYKKNYQATFTAKLLYPGIANYEVMPWPERIYEGLYKKPDSDEKERIPRHYSTQMQVMVNALNQMPKSSNKVSGSNGISVLMANSLMFQTFPTHKGYEDPDFSNFYGQTLPLLKRGVPVKTLHIENVAYPDTWKDTKILIMTYSNMKPLSQKSHQHIADWVKKGGSLVYCGSDSDPFQNVMEWWNTGNNKYERPSDHLFQLMGLKIKPAGGSYRVGKGQVRIVRKDPKDFVINENGDEDLIKAVNDLYKLKTGTALSFKNNFTLNRGNYQMIAVLDESMNDNPLVLRGSYIDLFDPELPVLTEKTVKPGEQAFLFDLGKLKNKNAPQILASASRNYDERIVGRSFSFVSKSPVNTTNVMQVLLPAKPHTFECKNKNGAIVEGATTSWNEKSRTLKVSFENDPDGVFVKILW